MQENIGTKVLNRESEISQLVDDCLEFEGSRGLAEKTLKELRRYLAELVGYCQSKGFYSPHDLSPQLLKDYVEGCWERGNFSLVKAVVWAIRKFGAYLSLIQILPENPAQYLRHPRIPKRARLPEYLSATQLRHLLTTCADTRSFQDFTILSLLASVGLRTNEIVALNRDNVYLSKKRVDLMVKGGWVKKTPLSDQMSRILATHLARRKDNSPAVFINKKSCPLSESYIQRMVKEVGFEAELSFALTCRHLRHTFATHSVDKHGAVITKALLGHSKLATTRVYVHLCPSHFRGLMNLHPYQKKGGAS
jgi:site-specific recombinase XerC